MPADILAHLDADRLFTDLRTLAGFGALAEGGIHRPAFSAAIAEAEAWLMDAMRDAGMVVRRDSAGNIIGRLGPETAKAVICGSHIDTVRGGGAFDGALGVLSGLECVRAIRDSGLTLDDVALEVVSFTDEEGARYGLLGSKAMTGALDRGDIPDPDGLASAMAAAGLDLGAVGNARRDLGSILAYVELHIEQGPVLEQLGLHVGVVESIVGMDLTTYTVVGKARHAGTTPMSGRHDALVCAASAIQTAVATLGDRGMTDLGTMTFGDLRVSPGATNVVPGRVVVDSEVRAGDPGTLATLRAIVDEAFAKAARQSGLTLHKGQAIFDPPVELSRDLRDQLSAIAARHGLPFASLPSGACHDAQVLAAHVPSAMIFVESKGGISHHKDEHSTPEAIRSGAELLLLLLHHLLFRR